MNIYPPCDSRTFPVQPLHADFGVAGGGLAGLYAALFCAKRDNHHSACRHEFPIAIRGSELRLEILATAPALSAVYSLNVR